MNSGLVRYEAARVALREARAVDEAKDIHDKAEAVRAYARQVNDTEMVSWASEIKLRAMRRMGELLKEGQRAKGGDPTPSRDLTGYPTLKEMGVSRNASSLSQKIATIPEKEFEKHISSVREKHKEVTVAEITKIALKQERQRKQREREKESISNADTNWIVTDDQAVVSCDVMITDPPYGILKESWEPDKIEAFTREWLSRWNTCEADLMMIFFSQRYLWDARRWFDIELNKYIFQQLLIWHYANNKSPQSRKGFKQTWEPIFLYRHKDSQREIGIHGSEWGGDIHDFDCHVAAVPQGNFNGVNMKVHPAQKPLSVMRWLISATTSPGDIVADPFCGSGTTGVAAAQLKRGFHGIEIDGKMIKIAQGRIAHYRTI